MRAAVFLLAIPAALIPAAPFCAAQIDQTNPAPPTEEVSYLADAPTLPDLPQPQAPAKKSDHASPSCLLKRAVIGSAWAAARVSISTQASQATLAAAASIAKPLIPPTTDPDALLIPCTAEERLLADLHAVKRMPAIDWYARFLDGPQVQRMSPKQKGWLAVRNVADPFNALTIAASSAIAVAANSHGPLGPGFTGWGRQIGISYSQDMTGEFFGTFLIPSIVHQDPHYHRLPQATIKRRIAHVLYYEFWTQGDNGKGMLNYADLVGFGIDGQISNLYVPGQETNGRATAERYGIALALAPTDSAITEFLPDIARRIHVRVVLIQQIINQIAENKTNNSTQ
jgi:hypothetical protein